MRKERNKQRGKEAKKQRSKEERYKQTKNMKIVKLIMIIYVEIEIKQ